MNEALEGKGYPSVAFTVEQAHTARFARVVGHEGDGVPPTFPTAAEFAALTQVIEDPELALDFAHVLHAEQEYEYRRPLVVGDRLTLTPRLAQIRRKGALEFCTVETEMRDAAGDVVVIARNSLVVRGGA